jgi:hypothetical protein
VEDNQVIMGYPAKSLRDFLKKNDWKRNR